MKNMYVQDIFNFYSRLIIMFLCDEMIFKILDSWSSSIVY